MWALTWREGLKFVDDGVFVFEKPENFNGAIDRIGLVLEFLENEFKLSPFVCWVVFGKDLKSTDHHGKYVGFLFVEFEVKNVAPGGWDRIVESLKLANKVQGRLFGFCVDSIVFDGKLYSVKCGFHSIDVPYFELV